MTGRRGVPRIVSLLPSATEIVFALGLGDALVGVSHECDWPPEARTKTIVTRPTGRRIGARSRRIHELVTAAVHGGSSLYRLDEAALSDAHPDLILTQELCSVCAVSYRRVTDVVRTIDADVTVVSLEPSSLEGIFNTISTVGAMTSRERSALRLVERLRGRLARVERKVLRRRESGRPPVRVVALEWLAPPYTAGHWVPEQVRRAGGWDLLAEEGGRSTRTTWRAVRAVDPEMLVLAPGGLHVTEAGRAWERTPRPQLYARIDAVRRGNVFVVDGSSYYSRPGPRVIDGIEMLAEIFDPEAFIDIAPPGAWVPVS